MFRRKIAADIVINIRRINGKRVIKIETGLIGERGFNHIIVPVTLKIAFR
jgi:hypothetical protein